MNAIVDYVDHSELGMKTSTVEDLVKTLGISEDTLKGYLSGVQITGVKSLVEAIHGKVKEDNESVLMRIVTQLEISSLEEFLQLTIDIPPSTQKAVFEYPSEYDQIKSRILGQDKLSNKIIKEFIDYYKNYLVNIKGDTSDDCIMRIIIAWNKTHTFHPLQFGRD